ncbi:MAG: VOC family protein [Polaromonas sp.]|uniref:VOC family protein n=1 Tax=Polaromonas sp. TaxID=1869339 RepID=UPI0025FCC7E8|nr:VOC family protein [Polaromonas sp.]MBI2726978.1 VOC family protein [Polaromonas sp.]
MKTDIESAYIILESRNPAALNKYLGEVIGLMPGAPTPDGASTWRADGKAQRVVLAQGQANDATAIGFELESRDALDAAVARLRKLGLDPVAGTAAQKQERRVKDMVSVPSPWGVQVELVLGLEEAATPFASKVYPNGFVTGSQGFGHFVFGVAGEGTYAAARKFALEGLGLKLSDYLRLPMGPVELNVSFFHCNARHHSLAIANIPAPEVPQKLHHINFEVKQVADVGAAYERALGAGTPIANMLGQHENDGMVSFYSVGPDGWQVEVGATGRQITDNWDDVREYNRISIWGHQPPAVFAQMQGLTAPAAAPVPETV